MKKRGKNESVAIKDIKKLRQIQDWLKYNDYAAYILFIIGLATGYRGSDIVELTVGDIRRALEIESIDIVEIKTKNTRKVKYIRTAPIPKSIICTLKDFIRYKEDAEFIYPKRGSKCDDHISRDNLGKKFKKAAIECGVDRNVTIGTHTPRKTYGYIQYTANKYDDNGNERAIENRLEIVRSLLGHAKIKTTRSYIGLDEVTAKSAAETMNRFFE